MSVNLLAQMGVSLPFPHSSAIAGSEYPLRELRCQSGGKPLRIIYAFNPVRQSVLILGGDKTGDDRFYNRIVDQAEKIWKQYVAAGLEEPRSNGVTAGRRRPWSTGTRAVLRRGLFG